MHKENFENFVHDLGFKVWYKDKRFEKSILICNYCDEKQNIADIQMPKDFYYHCCGSAAMWAVEHRYKSCSKYIKSDNEWGDEHTKLFIEADKFRTEGAQNNDACCNFKCSNVHKFIELANELEQTTKKDKRYQWRSLSHIFISNPNPESFFTVAWAGRKLYLLKCGSCMAITDFTRGNIDDLFVQAFDIAIEKHKCAEWGA